MMGRESYGGMMSPAGAGGGQMSRRALMQETPGGRSRPAPVRPQQGALGGPPAGAHIFGGTVTPKTTGPNGQPIGGALPGGPGMSPMPPTLSNVPSPSDGGWHPGQGMTPMPGGGGGWGAPLGVTLGPDDGPMPGGPGSPRQGMTPMPRQPTPWNGQPILGPFNDGPPGLGVGQPKGTGFPLNAPPGSRGMPGPTTTMGGPRQMPPNWQANLPMIQSQGGPQMGALAAAGRGPDTQLAHVTPQEQMALKGAGGAGSMNPFTGLREYAGADPLTLQTLLQSLQGSPVSDTFGTGMTTMAGATPPPPGALPTPSGGPDPIAGGFNYNKPQIPYVDDYATYGQRPEHVYFQAGATTGGGTTAPPPAGTGTGGSTNPANNGKAAREDTVGGNGGGQAHDNAADRAGSAAGRASTSSGGGLSGLSGLGNLGFGDNFVDLGTVGNVGLGAVSMMGGPLGALASVGKLGVGANNLSYVDQQRAMLGMAPLSGLQKVGTVLGVNDYAKGYIGPTEINDKSYGVSVGGGLVNGKTTLSPTEANTRAQVAAGIAKQAIEAASRPTGLTGNAAREGGGMSRGIGADAPAGSQASRDYSRSMNDRTGGDGSRSGGHDVSGDHAGGGHTSGQDKGAAGRDAARN